MKGIGIVFAGGGGKGAYEIGVWKYLHEVGLDQYVRAVSGTSVGALNAALFVGGSYENAENLWLNINHEKILTPKKITAEDIKRWLVNNGFIIAPITMGAGKIISGAIFGASKFAQMLFSKMQGNHLFSREGIIQMISDGLDFHKLRTSEIPCFVTCLRCPGFLIERFNLMDYSDDDITTLLLASSAIPVIFPLEEFQGYKYCDGGLDLVGDNVPIAPIYDLGLENIIVIHLNQEALVDKEKYMGAKIIEIVPHEDLGNAISGTLDFSPEGARIRLNMGYEDAKHIIEPMINMITMTAVNQNMLKFSRQNEIEFQKKRQVLLDKENGIKKQMAYDGLDLVLQKLNEEQ